MGLLGKNEHQVDKNQSVLGSFKHAYDGIVYAVVRESNMHIHLLASLLVVVAGVIFGITRVEWFICIILIGLVISLELINTAIEACVDLITTKENPLAKVAKDVSAGAVLVISIVAAIIGLSIFIPRLVSFLSI